MKIDIHVHTKKMKSGEPSSREIDPAAFCEIMLKSNVKICAITNHNHFDNEQYEAIMDRSENYFQTWPGVELDVKENGKSGHLILIVSPKNAQSFADKITDIMAGTSVDDFSISLKEITEHFNHLDPIYVPHYHGKAPSISEDDIEVLINNCSNQKRILKEVSNSISAGIFISHGHKSIYGSDIQDWKHYLNEAKNLPDLRLPVESFEQFCLLLDRDDSTIKTILDKKNREKITLQPFKEDKDPITIEIFDDINVLFGSKGTGKTEILKALSVHYNKNGYKTNVYESSAVNLDSKYDIECKNYKLDPNILDIDSCADEFSLVRGATESVVTSLKKYFEYFSEAETNKISERLKVNKYSLVDKESSDTRFKKINDFKKYLNSFATFLQSDAIFKEIIEDDLFGTLIETLEKVEEKVDASFESEFVRSNTIRLYNHLIQTFVSEIARKTGKPEKPIKTGFRDYARNRIKIEISLKKIISTLDQEFKPRSEFISDLGEKGRLFCKTLLVIQNGGIIDGKLQPVKNANNTPQKSVQKKVASRFKGILGNIYSTSLFEKISDLNNVENGSTISSIEDLFLVKRFFEINRMPYKPSNGESAMILLSQELKENKEIYLIDEPEKSLGNDYINDFIVPLLKEHAYSGKRVIIATHDANIAVRTLPYNSIYRAHATDCYHTYLGNPFSNNLICETQGICNLDWKEISMRILEGGKDAFGERGKIYAES